MCSVQAPLHDALPRRFSGNYKASGRYHGLLPPYMGEQGDNSLQVNSPSGLLLVLSLSKITSTLERHTISDLHPA